MLRFGDRIRPLITLGLSAWVALSILEILPDEFFQGIRYVNSTLSFSIMALYGLVLIRLFQLRTWAYFRLPEKTKLTFIALAIVLIVTVPPIFSVDRENKSLSVSEFAIFFLVSIGIAEEIFSRGFHYGYLEKYGRYLAIIASSAIFGLMHLNRYAGDAWDPWMAYAQVISAFGFGLLACALMIATKSIWVAVIFHALANWDLAFPRVGVSGVEEGVSEYVVGRLLMPLTHLTFFSALAFLLLWFSSGSGLPQMVKRAMVSLKLVDSEK